MSVEDMPGSLTGVAMSRLDFAKTLVQDGVSRTVWEQALIVYAREASLVSPLSSDSNYLISRISDISPVELYGGSDVLSAISLAKMLYWASDVPLRIIIVTDGGSTNTDTALNIPDYFHISLIGLGTDVWGKIPLGYDANGERRYKYYAGKEIIVRYEGDLLQKIADKYKSTIAHIASWQPQFPLETNTRVTPLWERYMLLVLATICILIGYIYHPYAEKK